MDKVLVAGNVKAAMKAVDAVSADLWQVNPADLRVLPGFNVRVKNDAYTARVEWIANSILANGYYKDKPLSGFVAKEDGVDVIYVTGGHRRHEAVALAIERGANIPAVPVIIKPKGTSMEDLTVDLYVGNDGEPLSVYEQAVVCKRLTGFGWESKEIARRLGYSSTQYVDQLLTLAAAPLEVRQAVVDGIVSATVAISLLAKYGDKAVAMLEQMKAKAAGGKVTAKHSPEAAFNSSLRKQARPMYDAITKLKEDPAYMELSTTVRDALDAILGGVKKC